MQIMKSVLVVGFTMMLITAQLKAQKGMPAKDITSATVNTNFPQHVDFKEAMLGNLKIAEGFKVGIAATGLGKPRMLCLGNDGGLYVTRRDQGDVLMLRDKDKDGRFEELKTVVVEFPGVHGITINNGYMYLIAVRELKRGKMNADGTIGPLELLIKDLPDGGQHANRTIAFGPDGKLYITVGSTCNDCFDANPENATILQVQPGTWKRKIYSRGLRNTIGFDWHPQTGEIWGADHGSDYKGDDIPPEELNRIKDSANYGWPLIYAHRQIDLTREDPPGTTKAEYAKMTEPSVITFPAHSAPLAFQFLSKANGFPADYKDDALMTMHGSWNKKNPDGYNILRVKYENGQPTGYETFLTGFLNNDARTRFGRPCGLAVSPQGIVYFSDDANGVIYSISTK